MMQNRNPYENHWEPKVIALAAAKTNPFTTLSWQIGLAVLAYSWMTILLK